MYDVARGFTRRVPLGRLVEVEPDIRPYLGSLLIWAIAKAGDKLVIPEGL